MSTHADISNEQLVLVLADISGYTRFVHLHRMSEAHAEVIITELLEEVIEATELPLELHQLLGDAAVFFARSDGSTELARDVFEQVQRASERFRIRAAEVSGECALCACDACRGAGTLRLKVIIHHGQAVLTRQRGFVKLAGEDVIVAHRLLKNSIGADEYVLVTEPFQRMLGDLPDRIPERRNEDCEGVGEIEVAVYYPPDFTPAPTVKLRSRLRRATTMDAYAFGRIVTKRPRRAFTFGRSARDALQISQNESTGLPPDSEPAPPATAARGSDG